MLKQWVGVFLLCGVSAPAWGASRLDGTSFQVSILNLPDSVGVVRAVDDVGSNCRDPDPTPIGDDGPGPNCLTVDSGGSAVTMTFGAGPQTVGGLTVIPRVTEFSGRPVDDPVIAQNGASGITVPLETWDHGGEIIEFTMRTTNNTYPQTNPTGYWGFAATGMQYPNSAADSEVGFYRDNALDTHNNFFYWFEDANGPIKTGYDIQLPVGLGVGQHPTDPTREVVYIFYSNGEVDDNTDSLLGGSLDFYSHGSDLDDDPNVGNLGFLAQGSGIDASKITGFGFGMLVEPPALAQNDPCDLNGDGAVDAADAGIMFADWGGPGSTSIADKNSDGFVDAADAGVMFEAWTGDPDAPADKAATAEYNPETGVLVISSAGAVNVFVQSASNAITPVNPAPSVPVGLLTNNTGRVGITNLGPINVTNFSFGNIGKGLAMSDLKLVYTTALGTKGIEVPAALNGTAFRYIPEPASFGLIGLGLAGLLAARRRS